MKRIVSGTLAVALLALAGCAGAPAQGTPPAPRVELTVSAAASLTDCMEEIKALYAQSCPEVVLTFNLGSSGALQQQIEQGAPVDVFVSAGKKQMDALREKGLMEEATVRDILENKVVLVSPLNNEAISSYEALAGDAVESIAVGEPQSVPVGQYTAEIFENLGIAEQVEPKLVFAKDVREVLAWVESGNVQYGIVYETDAKISDKVFICATAPEGSHTPVVYPAGVVEQSKYSGQARAFVEFLSTATAQNVFEKYGFTALQ